MVRCYNVILQRFYCLSIIRITTGQSSGNVIITMYNNIDYIVQVFIVTMQSAQLSSYQHVIKAKLNGSDKLTEVVYRVILDLY